MVISENYCVFIVLNYKVLQTIIAMITEDKVTELFFMSDEFCKFFDWRMARYTLKNTGKRPYHRESTLSKAESCLSSYCFMIQGTVASSISILIIGKNKRLFLLHVDCKGSCGVVVRGKSGEERHVG